MNVKWKSSRDRGLHILWFVGIRALAPARTRRHSTSLTTEALSATDQSRRARLINIHDSLAKDTALNVRLIGNGLCDQTSFYRDYVKHPCEIHAPWIIILRELCISPASSGEIATYSLIYNTFANLLTRQFADSRLLSRSNSSIFNVDRYLSCNPLANFLIREVNVLKFAKQFEKFLNAIGEQPIS